MDDLVPQDHIIRLIDRSMDFSFIYDLVEEKYCLDNGRPSLDPVMLMLSQNNETALGFAS